MKLLLDTNVLIDFFRNPRARQEFDARAHRPLLFISSVVVLELFAGCRTSRHEKELKSFLKPFETAERLIVPDHACFKEAGRVLAELARDGVGRDHLLRIANDVLIAVSATRSGVTVVTANSGDFGMIQRHTPVRWMLPAI